MGAAGAVKGIRRFQGYDIRFVIEPKPNEPRGDILLPTLGPAIAFTNEVVAALAAARVPELFRAS